MGGECLSDACIVVMGQSPPGDSCNTEGIGLPLLNGPTEYGPHHPSPVQFTTDARKHAHPGDVLFCVRGSTTGRMNWADQRYAIGRGIAALRHKDDPSLQPFVRAAIEFSLADLLAQATGSTFPNVSANQLAGLWWPPLDKSEQRAIAHILGTLDDKIELNRKMSETLEEMARALFTSWFVNFDPVRAKAEGRDTGLPKEIADLFPDAFEDSELGEIPKGWTVGPLETVLVLQRGFDLPAPARTAGAYPVLAASGPSGTHNELGVRGPGVTTGRSGVLGKVFYVHTDFWPLNTSLWVKEFRKSTPAYAFHLLRKIDLGAYNAGSAVPTLNRNHVHGLPTLVPPEEIIAAFDRIASANLVGQKHFDEESLTLAKVRDGLLPKLVSGAVTIAASQFSSEAQAYGED